MISVIAFQLMSPLLIKQNSAEIDLKLTDADISLGNNLIVLQLGSRNFMSKLMLTRDITQTVAFQTNSPFIVSFSTIQHFNGNKYLIPKVRYLFNTLSDIVEVTSIKLNPHDGIFAVLLKNQIRIGEFVNLKVQLFSDYNVKVVVDYTSEMLNSSLNEISCVQQTFSTDGFAAFFHCCNSNFTCFQEIRQFFQFKNNQATVTIMYKVNDYLISTTFDNIFINSLQKFEIASLFSIDDTSFLATIRLYTNEEIPSQIDFSYIQIQVQDLFFDLRYDSFLAYYEFSCYTLQIVDEYQACIQKIRKAKAFIILQPELPLPVTVFLTNQQSGVIWRRISFQQIVGEILATVNIRNSFENGHFSFIFRYNFGPELHATIYLPDGSSKNITIEAVQQNVYWFWLPEYKKFTGQYVEFIINVQEIGLTYMTQYYYVVKVQKDNQYVSVYSVIFTVFTIISLFFLKQSIGIDVQNAYL